jgi:murein DD-endopeptidase MepM/ murein hydrolase activator NlpD
MGKLGRWLMSRRGITVKIVPHSEGQVRDRHLPYWLLLLIGLVAAAIITTLVVLGIRFAQQAVDEQRLLTLRERTVDQQEQLAMFQEQINKLESEVASLDELIERLQEINPNVDLQSPDILEALEQAFESSLPLEAVREGGAAGRQAIGRLVERARHLAEGLTAIEANLETDPALVRFTPSLRPVAGEDCYVTAGFGNRHSEYTGRTYFHRGIAITAPLGTPVLAPADGTVVSAEHEGNFGLKLIIDHGGYYRTVYTHLQRVYVQPGQQVTRAQPIATVGNTGRTFGPKLHYEVIKGGRNLNPARFFLPEPGV